MQGLWGGPTGWMGGWIEQPVYVKGQGLDVNTGWGTAGKGKPAGPKGHQPAPPVELSVDKGKQEFGSMEDKQQQANRDKQMETCYKRS